MTKIQEEFKKCLEHLRFEFCYYFGFRPALARHDVKKMASRHGADFWGHTLSSFKPDLGQGFRASNLSSQKPENDDSI